MPPLPVVTFWSFAAVILASAILVVTRRNAISSALFLALSLRSVAGLYVSLRAELLFVVQILVYTGGIMVLFLFVIMLVNVDELERRRAWTRGSWFRVVPLAFTFAALIGAAFQGEAITRE